MVSEQIILKVSKRKLPIVHRGLLKHSVLNYYYYYYSIFYYSVFIMYTQEYIYMYGIQV